MTGLIGVSEILRGVMAAWSGKQGQRQDRDADTKSHQRRDGVPDVGGPLAWWPASVTEHLAAEDHGEQERAGGEEHRDGVGHGGMVPHD